MCRSSLTSPPSFVCQLPFSLLYSFDPLLLFSLALLIAIAFMRVSIQAAKWSERGRVVVVASFTATAILCLIKRISDPSVRQARSSGMLSGIVSRHRVQDDDVWMDGDRPFERKGKRERAGGDGGVSVVCVCSFYLFSWISVSPLFIVRTLLIKDKGSSEPRHTQCTFGVRVRKGLVENQKGGECSSSYK